MNLLKKTSILICLLFFSITTWAQVTVYEHTNFNGKNYTYYEGFHTLPAKFGNDILSSIKVSPGWKVTLYEHNQERGRKLELTSSSDNLMTLNFNDMASNILVEKVGNSGSEVALKASNFILNAFSVNQGKGMGEWFIGFKNSESNGSTAPGKIIQSNSKDGSILIFEKVPQKDLGDNVYMIKVRDEDTYLYVDYKTKKVSLTNKNNFTHGTVDALFKTHVGFTKAPGSEQFISFESLAIPGHFLRHSGYQLFVNKPDGSELFNQDASWKIQTSGF